MYPFRRSILIKSSPDHSLSSHSFEQSHLQSCGVRRRIKICSSQHLSSTRLDDIMQLIIPPLLLAFCLVNPTSAASDDTSKTKLGPPCTVHSPSTGTYFDLRPISLTLPKDGKKSSKD